MTAKPTDCLKQASRAGAAGGNPESERPVGAVQPFGFLIAFSQDWMVEYASRNASRWLMHESADLCGRPLDDIFSSDAVHAIRGRLQLLNAPDLIERIFGLPLQEAGPPFDIALHRSGDTIILEAEPSLPEEFNTADLLRNMTRRLQQTRDVPALCREATRLMRVLTSFDRVMIFRFEADGSGEVVAESIRSDLESTIGWRYPASGLPAAARALYERNWLRIVTDVNAEPSPILSRPNSERASLDLSMSFLRSVAPSHREFLDQMGVAASLSVSILRAGKLWGLLACHNVLPRHVTFEVRTAFELFGQMFSWLLESREREVEEVREARARDLHDQLMGVMATGTTTLAAVTDHFDQLSATLHADGIGAWIDGDIKLSGSTPSREQFTQLVRHLSTTAGNRVVATNEISADHPPAAAFAEQAVGHLAIPISRTPRDYLVFFRQEWPHTVFRMGRTADTVRSTSPSDPAAGATPQPSSYVVRGQSMAWSTADLRFAESLRIMLLDVILRLTAVAEDERKAAQDRQELLIAELNHRVRNILGLIRGLVTQSRSGIGSVDEYATVIGARIQALARAHDQITQRRWEAGSLRDLVVSEASAYLGGKADRVRLDGPPILVDPRAFSALALVIHELMTNSAKYGALRDAAGQIDVTWTLEATQGLVIDWHETGGPPVAPPTRRGFGTTIIERSIPYELNGQVEVRYEATGVEARLVIPSGFAQPAPGSSDQPEETPLQTPPVAVEARLTGTALVVEDNIIIALDAEEMLHELGATAVETTASVRDALRAIEKAVPDFALLDLNLGSESSLPVAERLRELGVPLVFATGYGDNHAIPSHLSDIVVIEKPFTPAILRATLGKLLNSPNRA